MSSHFPPLTCKEVKIILKNLGFNFKNQKGSHEQWIKDINGERFKVTVDCPKAPFDPLLIKYMASQAGVSKKEFYAALKLENRLIENKSTFLQDDPAVD